MLILTRSVGSKIKIGDNIVITLVEIKSYNRARIGITAPSDLDIVRDDARNNKPRRDREQKRN